MVVLIFACYSAPAPTCARFQEQKFKISHCVITRPLLPPLEKQSNLGHARRGRYCKRRDVHMQSGGRERGGWRPGHPGRREPQSCEQKGYCFSYSYIRAPLLSLIYLPKKCVDFVSYNRISKIVVTICPYMQYPGTLLICFYQ